MSDIDTAAVVNGLKVLDPKRPIREADIGAAGVYDYIVECRRKKSSTISLKRPGCSQVMA